MDLRGKKVLLVLAPTEFRDEEYQQPKEVLQGLGAKVEVASKGTKEALGMLGAKVLVDKEIEEVDPADYEAVVFVGGKGAAVFFDDPLVLGLAKKFYEQEKVVGAICIAPSILAASGVLSGKKATAFPTQADNLKAKGAFYTGEEVTVDGRVVTAKGPEAAQAFAQKIAEVLSGK